MTLIEREDFDYKEHFDDRLRQKTLIPNPTLVNVKKISIKKGFDLSKNKTLIQDQTQIFQTKTG